MKGSIYPIQCGEGIQSVQWLANTTLYRHFRREDAVEVVKIKKVSDADGETVDLTSIVRDTFGDGDHILLVAEET